MFRLPGIYGPGRSPLDRVRAGKAHRVDVAGQVFSRVHVDDIVRGVRLAFDAPPGAYNLSDDLPCAQNDVIGIRRPRCSGSDRRRSFRSTACRRRRVGFYAENRRVANGKAKRVLNWGPAWPDYRFGLRALSAMTSPASASAAPPPASHDQR